jgi:hypothetical protein
MTVQITGLKIIKNPRPNKSGYVVLAFFNCAANGFELDGCALMQLKGMISISPPLIIDDTHQKRISIADPDLRDEITGSILLAYRGLGGKIPGDGGTANGKIPQEDQPKRAAMSATVPAENDEGLARFMRGAA